MKVRKPIIICGGGIGGLTFANCLKLAKIDYVVLECAHKYVEVGGGIGLWGPALKALNAIGLEKELSNKGKMMECAGYRRFNQIDTDEWLVKPSKKLNRHTSCLAVRRSYLQFDLLKNVEEKIKMNSKIVSFSQNKDSVKVKLENGDEVDGSLLIGADGINSVIRKQLFPDVKIEKCHYNYWQGICDINNLKPIFKKLNQTIVDNNFASYEAWHPGIRFGSVPLKEPELFWFIASDINVAEGKREMKENILDNMKMFGEIPYNIIKETTHTNIHKYDLNSINKMKSWGYGRVFLLGDAVHGMAPNLAQGACLSIEDALELAHEIYKISDNENFSVSQLEQLKRNYEKKRINRCKIVQTLVPWVHSVGTAYAPYNRIRDFFFKFPFVKIKTKIFDNTHRFALGWSYTPPNLGNGLYCRLLSKDFLLKTKSLINFHSNDVDRYCKGTVKVERGKGIGKLLAILMGLPKDLTGTIELNVLTDKNGTEVWKREFYSTDKKIFSKFSTVQSLYEESLYERYGVLFFILEIEHINNNRFDLYLKSFGLDIFGYKIRFPKFLTPIVTGITVDTEIGWKFDVNIKSPKIFSSFIGNILRYNGEINEYKIK